MDTWGNKWFLGTIRKDSTVEVDVSGGNVVVGN